MRVPRCWLTSTSTGELGGFLKAAGDVTGLTPKLHASFVFFFSPPQQSDDQGTDRLARTSLGLFTRAHLGKLKVPEGVFIRQPPLLTRWITVVI